MNVEYGLVWVKLLLKYSPTVWWGDKTENMNFATTKIKEREESLKKVWRNLNYNQINETPKQTK